ncbi:YlbL family protein [Brachybacterium kimchii]|uniref:YlbL family protein n=1 Tax=Brachybacterium kimchii TaxID=2942909 RepID=UPI0024B644A7|nr:PDZ domain-containing protein [Brachybacterium kimchii]
MTSRPPGPTPDGAQPSHPAAPENGTQPRTGEPPAGGSSADGTADGEQRMGRVTRFLGGEAFAHPRLAAGSLLVICAMLLGAMFVPVPYVVEQPGPAIDVLGKYDDKQVLSIEGHKTYPTDGSLMMTTVSVDGGPGYPVTPVEVVRAWFDSTRSVLPRELVFPEEQTAQETTLENSVQMSSSQQEAVVVALDELDIDHEDSVQVSGVEQDSPADGVLEPGDRVLAIGGTSADSAEAYRALAAKTTPGDEVAMRVERDGKKLDLQVPTREVDGKARMGIVLADGYEFPFDVNLGVGDVGGPSAGTMFALSIYDELTPGALTGGQDIAGTGTIDEKGKVGAIGGIRQKMVGARDSGADYFLAPASNCDEVAGHVPDGLQVVKVDDFDGALHAVQTIAKDHSTKGLPTCG